MLYWSAKNLYQPVKNYFVINDSIQKFLARQGDDYSTGYLLHYSYFKEH